MIGHLVDKDLRVALVQSGTGLEQVNRAYENWRIYRSLPSPFSTGKKAYLLPVTNTVGPSLQPVRPYFSYSSKRLYQVL